jgi:hypothetical protein
MCLDSGIRTTLKKSVFYTFLEGKLSKIRICIDLFRNFIKKIRSAAELFRQNDINKKIGNKNYQ